MRWRSLLGVPAEQAEDLAGLRIEHLLRSVRKIANDMERLSVNEVQPIKAVDRTLRMRQAAVEKAVGAASGRGAADCNHCLLRGIEHATEDHAMRSIIAEQFLRNEADRNPRAFEIPKQLVAMPLPGAGKTDRRWERSTDRNRDRRA